MALLEIQRGQQSSNLQAIPSGAAGVRATLDHMIIAANRGALTSEVNTLAHYIISGIDRDDYDGQIAAIQSWVSRNIQYVRDPINAETIRDPVALLAHPYGDCDDQATLVGALAGSIGFPFRFVAIGTQYPGEFDHVFAEVKLGTVWVSVETTEPVSIGWQPPADAISAKMIRHA